MSRSTLALMRGIAAMALAGAAAACDAPTAAPSEPGFDPTSLTGGLVYHWSPGATISVFADPTGFEAGYDLAAAVVNAGRVWRSGVFYREFDLRLAAAPADADVIVHYKFTPRLVNTVVGGGDCDLRPTGVAGYTLFCPDTGTALLLPLKTGSPSGRVKMDIFVDPGQVSDAFLAARGVTRQQAFRSLVAHEIGHALGIGGHSDQPDDLMYTIPTAHAPTERDASALRHVLHRKADIRF